MATANLSFDGWKALMTNGGWIEPESGGTGNGNFAGIGYFSVLKVSWGALTGANNTNSITFKTTIRKNTATSVVVRAYLSTQGFSGTQDTSKIISQSSKTVTFSATSYATQEVSFTLDIKDRSTTGETLYIWMGGDQLYHHFQTSSGTVDYTLKTYSVTYDANGGTGAPSKQTKTHGTALTLSSTKPTKANGSNTVTGSFKITGNANGGYFGNVTTTTTTITASTSRTDTIKYSFSSWNTKKDGSGTSYSAGGSYTKNAAVTLYAQYSSSTTTGTTTYSNNAVSNLTKPTRANSTQATYTVKFDANGATAAYSDKTVNTTRKYTFGGWAISANATSANAAATYTKATTVYAYWTYNDTKGTITLPSAPSRPGYKFLGWGTSATQTSNLLAAGATSPGISANTTYYAIWKLDGNIRIYTNDTNKYQKALVYIHDGSSWKLAIPYLHNGTTWKIVGG